MRRSTSPPIEKKNVDHPLSVNIKHEIRKITTTKIMKIYAMSMDVHKSVVFKLHPFIITRFSLIRSL